MADAIDRAPMTFQILKDSRIASAYARIDNNPAFGQPRGIIEDDQGILRAVHGRHGGNRTEDLQRGVRGTVRRTDRVLQAAEAVPDGLSGAAGGTPPAAAPTAVPDPLRGAAGCLGRLWGGVMRAGFCVTWLVAATLAGECAAQVRDDVYELEACTGQEYSDMRIELRWPEIHFYETTCNLSGPQPLAGPGDAIRVRRDLPRRGRDLDQQLSDDDRARWRPDPGP